MIKNSLVFYILFLLSSSFAQELEILSSGNQNYKQIDPTNITTEFLYFQAGTSLDSIQIEDIKSVIIENRSDIPLFVKGIFGTAYFSLFYYMLEYMYKEAPFTIPQFAGVFSVFILTGTGAGIIYGKIINSYPKEKTSYDFSTMPVKEKYTILKQILTNNKASFHKTA